MGEDETQARILEELERIEGTLASKLDEVINLLKKLGDVDVAPDEG